MGGEWAFVAQRSGTGACKALPLDVGLGWKAYPGSPAPPFYALLRLKVGDLPDLKKVE